MTNITLKYEWIEDVDTGEVFPFEDPDDGISIRCTCAEYVMKNDNIHVVACNNMDALLEIINMCIYMDKDLTVETPRFTNYMLTRA